MINPEREALIREVLECAEEVVLADSCTSHYTCEGAVQDDLWFGEGEVRLDQGKPLCPWIVRPGKCQPECAMMQLKNALLDLQIFEAGLEVKESGARWDEEDA